MLVHEVEVDHYTFLLACLEHLKLKFGSLLVRREYLKVLLSWHLAGLSDDHPHGWVVAFLAVEDQRFLMLFLLVRVLAIRIGYSSDSHATAFGA